VFLISLVAIIFSLWIYFGNFEKIDVNSSEKLIIPDLIDSLLDSSQSEIFNPEVDEKAK
jgi:hypothetical protein